jgi:predicted secreted protein
MIRHALALGTVALFACHGCNDTRPPAASAENTASPASSSSASPDAAPQQAETVIHVDDDGKSFDTYKGSTVTFKLTSNSGTGYVWIPTQIDASILAQQGDRSSEIASDAPGAPKLDVYRFMAGAAGTSVVEMSLKRPFGSAPAARAIHVTINVH